MKLQHDQTATYEFEYAMQRLRDAIDYAQTDGDFQQARIWSNHVEAAYNADIASKEVEDRILSDMKEGNKSGVQGTPSFYLNGSKLTLDSTDTLKKILKETIEAANGSAAVTTTTK